MSHYDLKGFEDIANSENYDITKWGDAYIENETFNITDSFEV